MLPMEMTVHDSPEISWGQILLEGEGFAHEKTVRTVRNVRSVGFISKPGQIQELKDCLEGPLVDLLRQTAGFAGAMILHAQKESRNLWVLTFWETENQATNNHWEESCEIRQLLSPLIDVRTKVRTFQATLPKPAERGVEGKATAASC